MLLLLRERPTNSMRIHYVPERGVVQIDDNTLIARNGNVVIVQSGKQKFSLEAPSTLNMTTRVFSFIPLDRIISAHGGKDPVAFLHELEEMTYNEEMPKNLRHAIRLYAALLGLSILESVPETYKENVVLTLSRLTGERISDILARKREIIRKLEEELHYVLSGLKEEELSRLSNVVLGS